MLTRAERVTLAVTATVIALTRLIPLAKGPWDWDEVLFCLALRDYDVGVHQPHPPGFPLYIFLARIVRLVADSDFHALQTVNVIAGMLAFPVMFAVARAFRLNFVISFWTAVLFAFLPNVWFFGGTAFSDLPAAILFLGAIAAFLFAARSGSARTYALASIILASGLLVRPHNFAVAVFPWALATSSLVRAKRWRTVAIGTSLTAGLTILGYALGAWATGFQSYFLALVHHSQFVTASDSVAAALRPSLYEALKMMLDPFEAGKASILLDVLALIGIVHLAIRRQRELLRAILFTFGPFFVFAWLAVNPLGSSRFSLNWMAGVVLLAALGVSALAEFAPRWRTAIFALFLVVLLGRLIPWTLPAFDEPRRSDAPPVAAAKWVETHVPRTSIVFVDESIWPWAKYYIRNHVQVRPHDVAHVVIDRRAVNGVYLSMDPAQVRGEKTFTRPRNRTWNLVVHRAFESYVIPARSVVSFDHGWYAQEGTYPDIWRWSSKRATIRFVPIAGAGELRLKFEVPIDVIRHPVRVTFTLNGNPIGTHVATTTRNEVRYVVTPRADAVNVLRIEVSDTFIPVRLHMSDDWRQLGIMLQSWEWKPVAASAARNAA